MFVCIFLFNLARHIYRKWNERFFEENMVAWKDGRAEKDPTEYWYKGEIGFSDFYIVPLAKKLAECGVFGVSSDEYKNYALQNREEWVSKGQSIVKEMVEKYKKKEAHKEKKEVHKKDRKGGGDKLGNQEEAADPERASKSKGPRRVEFFRDESGEMM
jgi:hypothetical protein